MAAKRGMIGFLRFNRRTIFPRRQPRSRMAVGSLGGRKYPMTDRVAIITGAGSGIGRAAALNLLADGWSVVLAGRWQETLDEPAGIATGGKPLAVPADVTAPAKVDALFAKAKLTFGRLDMLF